LSYRIVNFKFFVDIIRIENTTIPQIIPIANAPAGLTAAQPAVTLQDPLKHHLASLRYLVFYKSSSQEHRCYSTRKC
jgi:hypothetical protein